MKGHFKVLNDQLMAQYIAKYSFELANNTILTYSLGKDGSSRVAAHVFGKNFTTSIRDLDGSQSNLCITQRAQEIWRDNFQDLNLGLIQNTLNKMYISNADITVDSIRAELNK